MLTINIATIAAIIAAITAIIAPTVTAVINQAGANRLRKSELFWNEKVKAYYEFISASCEFPDIKKDASRLEAAAYCASLFSTLETSNKLYKLSKELVSYAKSGDLGDVSNINAEALHAMREEIQKYQK